MRGVVLSVDLSLQLAARLKKCLAKAPELSLPQLTALLTIAMRPGLSVNDLADDNGFTQQTASRYVSVLSGRYQSFDTAEPSEALITQSVNESDPRRRALHLTEAGQHLVEAMTREIDVPTPEGQHVGS